MMPYTELAHGVWYPRGGMHTVVKALVGIARRAGVEFVLNAAVVRIDVRGNRVCGVTLQDGRRLPADAVLANADLPYVYKELLPPDGLGEQLERKRFSCSVISFFWGLKKRYGTLAPHNLFLADDYRENFESIIHDLGLPRNPSLYLHAPSRLDPSMAPEGEDTLIAIVPVGHLSCNGDQDWPSMWDAARRAVLHRLATIGITDLEENLKFEVSFNPLSWRRRYNLLKGATHGLCHNLMQLGYFRPHNRHQRYHNLYFAGSSTHPGTGVPTALVSGRLAARRLLDDLEA
jgi:phytoene desaturase